MKNPCNLLINSLLCQPRRTESCGIFHQLRPAAPSIFASGLVFSELVSIFNKILTEFNLEILRAEEFRGNFKKSISNTDSMKRFISSVLAVAAGLMLAGCTGAYDDSELRKGLDDLRDRVEQLESKLDKLNGDIETINALVESLQGGISIVK